MLKRILENDRVEGFLFLAIEAANTWLLIKLGMMMRYFIDTQMEPEFSVVMAQPGARAGFELAIMLFAGLLILALNTVHKKRS